MNTHSFASPYGRRHRQLFCATLALIFGLGTIPVLTAGSVWIIKSHWDNTYHGYSSLPPTTLVSYDEGTGTVTPIGLLKIAGSDVDLNGLAVTPSGTLHAFQLIGSPAISGSRLVTIDPVTRAVTPIGSPLPGIVIRGACCDPAGNIVAIDSKNQKLHGISPTGVVEYTVPLAESLGVADGYEDDSDIARLGDGRYVLSAYRTNPNRTVFYQVDITTGAMIQIGADAAGQPFDPYGPNSSIYTLGLTSSPSDPARLISLDGNGQEDLLAYQLPAFTRTLLSANVPPVPLADAGGADLAAAVVELNQPPVAICKDVTVAAGPDGTAQASIDNGSHDPDGEEVNMIQDPDGPYPIGTTPVTLTVIDSQGATAQCNSTVTVIDVSPPVPDLDSLPVIEGDAPLTVETIPTATDNGSGLIHGTTNDPLTYDTPGEYTIIWTYVDAAGNSITQEQEVVVLSPPDTTPPVITSLVATPGILWPPNHQMVPVGILGSATDDSGGPVTVKIINVTSNEPENGLGDGDTGPDWQVTGDLTLLLRAERSGKGEGRIYTLTVAATDEAGNTSLATQVVGVPKNMGKK